ncbi:D-2-hydroxyacid dehydrogenase family protein [Loktanella sp. SALINAS62]|uniref:D-2-hydroxyacid dehydrogenase family protein n=1 Tax=Loktanella sp. SALINAS62 TaxID=2706124 RepID=UPI001B8C3C08|nr:D-2-hydroxyacid dehydrogenase family protein [Loktanella sp. SALINAS62]MBS1303124.1 D-2-hydroxyacid dehydrogenase family protein [Loktanella sp. SALINAS62]
MKIAVLDDYARAALRLADWDGLGQVDVFADPIARDDLPDKLAGYDVVCLMRERTPMDADLIAALPALRLIVTSGPRNASIDLDAARAAGVTVCGTESRKTTTSELAVLMMLALNRRLLPEVSALHAKGWQVGLGRDVAGLTLGLIGLGNIGAQMATLGRALGMDIVAWSPNLTADRCAALDVARMDSLPDLMARADVTSVHMVLSDRTRGLVGADAFAAARQGQVFINTSRGPLVDTDALLNGLTAGRPAMAGLDVFDVEPLPMDDPLRDPDLIASGRLLLTPHLGYTTQETFRVFYTQTVEAIRAFQAGDPIRTI